MKKTEAFESCLSVPFVMTMYRALHGYKATAKNQLSFSKGELFSLQAECGNGWLTVKKGDATGIVHSSYLEVVIEEVGYSAVYHSLFGAIPGSNL